jgi:hypothetical protein
MTEPGIVAWPAPEVRIALPPVRTMPTGREPKKEGKNRLPKVDMPARDLSRLQDEIAKAKRRFGLPTDALHLTGPALRFFETPRSLQPALPGRTGHRRLIGAW